MMLVPLFRFEIPDELAATSAGISNRRHEWSGFDIRYPQFRALVKRMSNPKLH
jgi:hypothetical protein